MLFEKNRKGVDADVDIAPASHSLSDSGELPPYSHTDISKSEAQVHQTVITDGVFGDLDDNSGPNYRAVGKWGALILMTKANLGLGVLALPSVYARLGMVPGIICIIVIQTIIAYCGVVIGSFKIAHPSVHSLADAGGVMGGRVGGVVGARIVREFLFLIFLVFMIFILASACVGVSTALNAVSSHGACTAVFVVVSAIAGFLLGSIRTLGKVSWIGWVGIFFIMASILTLTVAVGVQERPAEAPQAPESWDKDLKIFAKPTFAVAMTAINDIVFSYGATPMYWGIVSEMRDPRRYAPMMVLSVCSLTVVYLIIGSVVYYYCGQYVASPALGSAGLLMKKVCYGISIPGLLASLTIFTHICGKTIFVRIMKGSRHLAANTVTHWVAWLGCTFGSVLIGYIIASAIPNFGSIIGLVGALFCPIVCIIPYTFMWWHLNLRFSSVRAFTASFGELTFRKKIAFFVNLLFCLLGFFLLAAGTYASALDLRATTSKSKPWSCENNSGPY